MEDMEQEEQKLKERQKWMSVSLLLLSEGSGGAQEFDGATEHEEEPVEVEDGDGGGDDGALERDGGGNGEERGETSVGGVHVEEEGEEEDTNDEERNDHEKSVQKIGGTLLAFQIGENGSEHDEGRGELNGEEAADEEVAFPASEEGDGGVGKGNEKGVVKDEGGLASDEGDVEVLGIGAMAEEHGERVVEPVAKEEVWVCLGQPTCGVHDVVAAVLANRLQSSGISREANKPCLANDECTNDKCDDSLATRD